MSVQVPVEELPSVARDYDDSAYVLISVTEGPPRITHSSVRFESGNIVVSVGRRAAGALSANPHVSILWPSTVAQPMSLIVDGIASGHAEEAGEVRIAPATAVRHRPASG